MGGTAYRAREVYSIANNRRDRGHTPDNGGSAGGIMDMGGCGRGVAARASRRLHERGSYICKCLACGAATPSRSLSLSRSPATPGATRGFTRGYTRLHPGLYHATPGATLDFAQGSKWQRPEINAHLQYRTVERYIKAYIQLCYKPGKTLPKPGLYHVIPGTIQAS